MVLSQKAQLSLLSVFMFYNAFITPSGIIYGWVGLEDMLKKEGQFSSGCSLNSSDTCDSQQAALGNIFAVAANTATVATIVFGFTLDKFGVRSNAIAGCILLIIGFILMAYSDSESFNAFIPGFALIAFGGLGTYLPAFQFAVLYSRPTRILSIQSALFGLAGLTFTGFTFLYTEWGVSRKTSFLAYTGFIALSVINMICLYPANAYNPGDKIKLPILTWLGMDEADNEKLLLSDTDDGVPISSSDRVQINGHPDGSVSSVVTDAEVNPYNHDPENSQSLATFNSSDDIHSLAHAQDVERLKQESLVRDLTHEEKEAVKNSYTLKYELFNPATLMLSLHFSFGLLFSNFTNANISDELDAMGDDDKIVSKLFVFITSIYPMFFAPLIDVLQRKYRYAGTSFLSTILLMISFAPLFIHNRWVQVPNFFVFATGRALLITVMFSFVATEYRRDHYGRVVAFITTICAIIGCLQLLMQYLLDGPFHTDYRIFNAFMIISMAPLLYFSYYLLKRRI